MPHTATDDVRPDAPDLARGLAPDLARDHTRDPLAAVKAAFAPAPGYLNAATLGLPPIAVADAMRTALTDWQAGRASATAYDLDVRAARAAYAGLVQVPTEWVAVGAQTSVFAGMVAASLPDGAEVVCVEGDFSSVVFPFLVHADRGVTVRQVPLDQVAGSVREQTTLVAFSLAQSACGSLSDGPAIAAAARAVGALTLCDTTQATGWLPVSARDYDMTVCSAYKWLCQPRGTAYFTIRPELIAGVRPVNAGWYAGADVWGSCYGPDMVLADDARRFDVSPAWLSWVGAVPALKVMGLAPVGAVRQHNVALANALCAHLSLPEQDRPVVSLVDQDGTIAAALAMAGALVASRAGRVRIAFHVWNTTDDVELVATALSGAARSA